MADQDIYLEDVPGLNGYGACPDSCEAAPGPGLGWAEAIAPAAISLGSWITNNYGTKIIGWFGGGKACEDTPVQGALPNPYVPSPAGKPFPYIKDTLPAEAAQGAMVGRVKSVAIDPNLSFWDGADYCLAATVVRLDRWGQRYLEKAASDGRAIAAVECPDLPGWACRTPDDFANGSNPRVFLVQDYIRIKGARPGEKLAVTDGTASISWQGTVPAGGGAAGFGAPAGGAGGAPSGGGGFGLGGLLGGGVATVGLLGLAAWLLLRGKK